MSADRYTQYERIEAQKTQQVRMSAANTALTWSFHALWLGLVVLLIRWKGDAGRNWNDDLVLFYYVFLGATAAYFLFKLAAVVRRAELNERREYADVIEPAPRGAQASELMAIMPYILRLVESNATLNRQLLVEETHAEKQKELIDYRAQARSMVGSDGTVQPFAWTSPVEIESDQW